MKRTLIRNATVVSVDPAIGELEGADILIEDERIAAVGRALKADAAESIDASGMIAIPGLVNAHIHTWEIPLRGIGADWVSRRDYHGNMHRNLAMRYTAEDVRLANLVGALNQINGGTTTLLDWCHVVRDAEMTDAAIEGLEESGVRAVFARGTVKPPVRESATPFYEIPFPREEVHRLRPVNLREQRRDPDERRGCVSSSFAERAPCFAFEREEQRLGITLRQLRMKPPQRPFGVDEPRQFGGQI